MAAMKMLAAMLSAIGLASIASADTGPRLSIFGVHVGEMARQRKVSVDEAVSAVRSWGFEAADLWFSEGEMPVNAKLLAGGLKPASLVLFMDYAYTNDVASAEAAIAYAKSVGSPRIMLVPGYVRKGDDRSEARKRMLPNLRDFMRRATAAGIQVDFEDFDASNALVGSQSDLRETFAAVPELGHVLDTGNYIFWHDDVLSAQREFSSRIRHVHIKDRPQGDLKQSTAAGTGVIPVREILANLRAANYGGWITVEDFGSTNMWDDVRISAEYLRKTWNSATPRIVVGISDQHLEENYNKIENRYVEAFAKTGYAPVVIPCITNEEALAAVVARLDMVVISGGADVSPARYGEKASPNCGTPDLKRDAFEFALIAAARRRHLPIVGICRGCQLVNVAFGGKLWQDLNHEYTNTLATVRHGVGSYMEPEKHPPAHVVKIVPGTRLAAAIGTQDLPVNSHHHQAVKVLAPGFVVTARAPDGVIEGFESLDYPAVGIQFHPEALVGRDAVLPGYDSERLTRLFKSFGNMAVGQR